MKKSPDAQCKSKKNDSQRGYTLSELLVKIKPRNKHSEVRWGKQIGKEII